MLEFVAYFITWTTYGTWLPGDARGWRKRHAGEQTSQPLLEKWCRGRMTGETVLLSQHQRCQVANACHSHAKVRGWVLHAINARSNHVHLVVSANNAPEIVRDEFKANATRVLRQDASALVYQRVWTRGGNCEVINGENDLEQVVQYVIEAQDRMGRES